MSAESQTFDSTKPRANAVAIFPAPKNAIFMTLEI